MIGRLSGIIKEKHPPHILLDVNGVGYALLVSMNTFYTLPDVEETAILFTHLLVREDALTLYGFSTRDERQFFEQLIKINGIGAKMALAILSGITRDDFVTAVQYDDLTSLVKLPGIGKKTAERIIIEMRDKIKQWPVNETVRAEPPVDGSASTEIAAQDAIEALISLGYKPADAAKMINRQDKQGKNSEQLIKSALRNSLTG